MIACPYFHNFIRYFYCNSLCCLVKNCQTQIQLTSHTPAPKRGAPSICLLAELAGLDSSTRKCPTYGKPQHLREIISLVPSRQRKLLTPSTINNLEPGKFGTRSLYSIFPQFIQYSTPDQLLNVGYADSSLPEYANSEFPGSGEKQ